MAVSIKNWLELREPPSSENSEMSFVRYKHVERVSMLEGGESVFHVLVHALNQTFLYSTHETMREAEASLVALVGSLGE